MMNAEVARIMARINMWNIFSYYLKHKNSIDCLDKNLHICNNIGESQKN